MHRVVDFVNIDNKGVESSAHKDEGQWCDLQSNPFTFWYRKDWFTILSGFLDNATDIEPRRITYTEYNVPQEIGK